nr:tectonin beta-propeller repeat-containing protein 1-like [Salvelinus alpinus]
MMFWLQVPGHLRCVESNSLGVVWGIGYDGTAWVYSGSGSAAGEEPPQGDRGILPTQTDGRTVYVFENQRWNPMTGYTDKLLPTDRSRGVMTMALQSAPSPPPTHPRLSGAG